MITKVNLILSGSMPNLSKVYDDLGDLNNTLAELPGLDLPCIDIHFMRNQSFFYCRHGCLHIERTRVEQIASIRLSRLDSSVSRPNGLSDGRYAGPAATTRQHGDAEFNIGRPSVATRGCNFCYGIAPDQCTYW